MAYRNGFGIPGLGQPIYKIGLKAGKLLFQLIEQDEGADEFCVLDTELIIRESTR